MEDEGEEVGLLKGQNSLTLQEPKVEKLKGHRDDDKGGDLVGLLKGQEQLKDESLCLALQEPWSEGIKRTIELEFEPEFEFEPELDIGLVGTDTLCMMCVMTPCVCLLTVLTGKINHLLERKDKDEGVHEAPVQADDGERYDRNKEHIEQVKFLKTNEEGTEARKQEAEEAQKPRPGKKEESKKGKEGTKAATKEQENLTGNPVKAEKNLQRRS